MIHKKLFIDRYDWLVYCFFGTTAKDAKRILTLIDHIGISDKQYEEANQHLYRSEKNSGMTYSNEDKRISVMIIGKTTSPEEMVNTFTHELRHLADDIAVGSDLPLHGEPVAYLTGNIAMSLAANLLHETCHCPVCSH